MNEQNSTHGCFFTEGDKILLVPTTLLLQSVLPHIPPSPAPQFAHTLDIPLTDQSTVEPCSAAIARRARPSFEAAVERYMLVTQCTAGGLDVDSVVWIGFTVVLETLINFQRHTGYEIVEFE